MTEGSRLAAIWDTHLAQYRRLDDLEKRIDEHARRLRRRVVNVLETAPTHRLSHLRLFVSHHDRSPESQALVSAHSAAPEESQGSNDAQQQQQQQQHKWTLVVEGKLLIGHLDHESAKAFDDRLKREFQERHKVSADNSSMLQATSENTSNTANPVEDEDPVEPITFTHFFDKMVAQFQTLYQPIADISSTKAASAKATPSEASTPKANTTPKASSSKKKSRSAKRQKNASATAVADAEEADAVDAKDLIYSEPKEFTWNKTITTISQAAADGKPAVTSTSTTTKDAAAFFVHYDSPPPPTADLKIYGAIATVQLYPSRGPEERYKPSKDFSKIFFPKQLVTIPPPVLPTTAIAEAKRINEEQEDDSASPTKSKKRPIPKNTAIPSHQTSPLALENEIHVPGSLTMKEILLSLFTYIQDNKLTSEDDPTLVENDKTLQGLFDCETMHYHELQTLLTQKRLVILLPKPAPIVLKYVMLADGTIPSEEDEDEPSLAAPMTMDLHNDVYVPNLFPYRARECLRRIKRRELDYTSNRTKARHLLMGSRAKDDTAVKNKIEEAVSGTTIGEWTVLACLAKAAPPHSEARTAAQLDAKIAYLLEQVERSQQAAIQAWELVDLCRSMGLPKSNIDEVDDNNDDEAVKMDDEKKPSATTNEEGNSKDRDSMDLSTGVKQESAEPEETRL